MKRCVINAPWFYSYETIPRNDGYGISNELLPRSDGYGISNDLLLIMLLRTGVNTTVTVQAIVHFWMSDTIVLAHKNTLFLGTVIFHVSLFRPQPHCSWNSGTA